MGGPELVPAYPTARTHKFFPGWGVALAALIVISIVPAVYAPRVAVLGTALCVCLLDRNLLNAVMPRMLLCAALLVPWSMLQIQLQQSSLLVLLDSVAILCLAVAGGFAQTTVAGSATSRARDLVVSQRWAGVFLLAPLTAFAFADVIDNRGLDRAILGSDDPNFTAMNFFFFQSALFVANPLACIFSMVAVALFTGSRGYSIACIVFVTLLMGFRVLRIAPPMKFAGMGIIVFLLVFHYASYQIVDEFARLNDILPSMVDDSLFGRAFAYIEACQGIFDAPWDFVLPHQSVEQYIYQRQEYLPHHSLVYGIYESGLLFLALALLYSLSSFRTVDKAWATSVLSAYGLASVQLHGFTSTWALTCILVSVYIARGVFVGREKG